MQSRSSNNRSLQGTSRDKIYQDLGLESLKSRRWNKSLSCMVKIMNNKAPNYLLNLVPRSQPTITNRNKHIPNYHCRTYYLKYVFFHSTLKDWFNLNTSIRNSQPLKLFKSRLLSFNCPIQSNVYIIFDPIGLKILTRAYV